MPPPMKQPAHLNRHQLNTSLAIAHGCFKRITSRELQGHASKDGKQAENYKQNYKDTHLKMERKSVLPITALVASPLLFRLYSFLRLKT
jgi:hypothetical protein